MLISPFGPFLMAPGRSSSGPDPYYTNVELLLHFDGSNGSTTFTDNGPDGRSPTVNGNAQISTAQSVFGGASGLFDGTGDSLQYTAGSQWNFGTGDWTIECRFRLANVSGFKVLVGLGTGGTGAAGSYLVSVSDNALHFYHEDNTQRITGGTAVAANTWYALAISCVSGAVKMFLDGTQTGSTYTASTAIGTSADDLYIGQRSAGNNHNGYIDELRITKGVGRYTGTYTPDGSAFPNL